MKKLINAAENVVNESLAGFCAAHSDIVRIGEHAPFVQRRHLKPGKVALVSGGGSGHEPLHGGFVGYGMLDAACPGEVFTSPVPDQMLAATKAVNGDAGVLHIVKNYTGDVLNFQMAAELAEDEGIEVVPVVINDDVAVQDSLYTAGRRGVGATVFVEKLAGALAEEGAGLDKVADLAREVNERSRSFGVALTSCTVPAAGKPTFDLAEAEIEMGIGIHGEPGRTRTALAGARELAAAALDAIHAEVFRAWIVASARIIDEQRDHLTQLDAAIGDADHGINLARGFSAVRSALESAAPATPGSVLTVTGSTLISKVGGASGPLYGVAFRRAGKALGDVTDVDLPGLAAALEAALAGVQRLGAAREGDKTMVDALAPALGAFSKAVAEGASDADALTRL